jgi:hypothetical protein
VVLVVELLVVELLVLVVDDGVLVVATSVVAFVERLVLVIALPVSDGAAVPPLEHADVAISNVATSPTGSGRGRRD